MTDLESHLQAMSVRNAERAKAIKDKMMASGAHVWAGARYKPKEPSVLTTSVLVIPSKSVTTKAP